MITILLTLLFYVALQQHNIELVPDVAPTLGYLIVWMLISMIIETSLEIYLTRIPKDPRPKP